MNYKGPKTIVSSDDTTLPNKLNDYYAQFDKANLSCPFTAKNGDTAAPFNISMLSAKANDLMRKKLKDPMASCQNYSRLALINLEK